MSYLVFIVVPESSKHLTQGIVATAASFFSATGSVKRQDVGRYARPPRKNKEREILQLVSFASETGEQAEASKAVAAETVLRATLSSSGCEGGEVRVFVKAE